MNFCATCGSELRAPFIGETPKVCPACGLEWWDPPVPVVIALVKDPDDNIVYTRNNSFPEGKWGLVAGFVEQRESAEDAAVREVQEETGLNVRVIRYIGSSVGSPGSNPKNLYMSYLCEPVSGEMKAGDDAEEVYMGPVDLDKFIPNSVAYRTVVKAGLHNKAWMIRGEKSD